MKSKKKIIFVFLVDFKWQRPYSATVYQKLEAVPNKHTEPCFCSVPECHTCVRVERARDGVLACMHARVYVCVCVKRESVNGANVNGAIQSYVDVCTGILSVFISLASSLCRRNVHE